MEGKFLFPKIVLLLALLATLAVKFDIAGDDLKGKPDKVQFQGFEESSQVSQTPASESPGEIDRIPVVHSQGDTPPTTYEASDPPTTEMGEAPTEGTPPDQNADVGWWAFIKANLGLLIPALLVFLESIVRLTKTEKDNSILNFIKSIFDFLIPNRAVGGGKHS
jgi:hypothetical protein